MPYIVKPWCCGLGYLNKTTLVGLGTLVPLTDFVCENMFPCFRSDVCGEEESSSSSGDDQRGLSAHHDGQQPRRWATHLFTSRCFLSSWNSCQNLHPSHLFFYLPPGFHAPRLVTIENCMKLTQMIVQGLQESKSPLLQLPHFEEEHLRYCLSKKVTFKCACVGGDWEEVLWYELWVFVLVSPV